MAVQTFTNGAPSIGKSLAWSASDVGRIAPTLRQRKSSFVSGVVPGQESIFSTGAPAGRAKSIASATADAGLRAELAFFMGT